MVKHFFLHYQTTCKLYTYQYMYWRLKYLSFSLSSQTLVGDLVIIQVIIYNCSFSLWGHLKSPLLAKGGEGIVNIKLTPLHGGPQGAKAWWCPRDVDVVVVVRWRVRVRVWGDGWLLLLGRGRAPRCPRPRGDSACGRRHLVVCSVAKTRKKVLSSVQCSVY